MHVPVRHKGRIAKGKIEADLTIFRISASMQTILPPCRPGKIISRHSFGTANVKVSGRLPGYD